MFSFGVELHLYGQNSNHLKAIKTEATEAGDRRYGTACMTQNGILSGYKQDHRQQTCGNFIIMLETIFSTLQCKILIY
jgi:hypothetical protein